MFGMPLMGGVGRRWWTVALLLSRRWRGVGCCFDGGVDHDAGRCSASWETGGMIKTENCEVMRFVLDQEI